MTATNHGLFGAVVAIGLQRYPAVAIAIAPFTHFLLDAFPHFGGDLDSKSKAFFRILFADMTLAVVSTLYIAYLYPYIWWLVIVCAFVASSPDLMWLWLEYIRPTPRKKWPWYARLHAWVQWSQTGRGVIVEAIWFVVFFVGLMYVGLA